MIDSIRFFERASPETIKIRFDLLLAFVSKALSESQPVILEKNLILYKINEINSKIARPIWESNYAPFVDVVSEALRYNIQIPSGKCHGDLTFSNVLFSIEKNQIGLLDFLDSFIDSPIIDIIKLRQDTRFFWTSSIYTNSFDIAKIKIVSAFLDKILSIKFKAEIKSNEYKVLEILNYLRIAPYVKNNQMHIYLKSVLKSNLQIKT